MQISQSQGTNWIVTSGLKAGEKVMVDGLIKVGMGAKKVTPCHGRVTPLPQRRLLLQPLQIKHRASQLRPKPKKADSAQTGK